jgi:hypothetical protein
MRLLITILMLSLGCLVSGCSSFAHLPTLTPSPTSFPPPTGTFDCSGIERGFYASVGTLILYPDGRLEFGGEGGTWMYEADTRQLTFLGNKYLAYGIYDPDQEFLAVTLQPDVAIIHSEGGGISCQLSQR